MPSVISKFMEKSEQTLKSNRTIFSGAIVGAVLLTYCYKVAVPLVTGHTSNNNKSNLNNNLVKLQSNERVPPYFLQTKKSDEDDDKEKKYVPTINFRFIFQFYKLIRIMIPHVFSFETALLTGHTACLFLRTFLSIYVAGLEGHIVKYIVRKDPSNFIKQLFKWFAVAVPATFINSMIRFLETRTALAFRTRLVEHSYRLYFKDQSYYRVTVLDSRLDNCAQRLTDDIETVSSSVAHLYGQVTKPLFDILLMSIALWRLARNRSAGNIILGPVIIVSVVCVSGLVLRIVSPTFGQLVAQEATKKGYVRHVHSRIVANAEEIAFYNGHKVEQSHLKASFYHLVEHMEYVCGVKLWFVMLEQFLMKYVWSGTGLIVVALPILVGNTPLLNKKLLSSVGLAKIIELDDDGNPILASLQSPPPSPPPHGGEDHHQDQEQDSVSDRTQYFTTAKSLLMTGSNAVERLMASYRDVVELAGHTHRVYGMFKVLEDASNGIYKKKVVEKKDCQMFEVEFKDGQPVAKGKCLQSTNYEIILNEVPIVTPNCDVVCPALTLSLRPGQHLLITGPNGCGKSSLFRILSGLWPIYGGELYSPKNSMFYIPQRPYMVVGNLKDQIIYPDTSTDMINKQVTDEDLRKIMRMVHLEHIVERDTFDQVKDWTDILSGGEKQRMAIARLFYHKPKYALLDECTSAVSIDVESNIYQTAIDMGITLLTITHRPTLWKFHTHILQFDGAGKWEFSEFNAVSRLNLKREKEDLLRTSSKDADAKSRLNELNHLLGEDDN